MQEAIERLEAMYREHRRMEEEHLRKAMVLDSKMKSSAPGETEEARAAYSHICAEREYHLNRANVESTKARSVAYAACELRAEESK